MICSLSNSSFLVKVSYSLQIIAFLFVPLSYCHPNNFSHFNRVTIEATKRNKCSQLT
uniref:Uncharacterized protein n=1 Tax=Anguilla anguilla TaxID=7936 RepID=A0A0E9PJ67_ANGAN